MSIPEWFSVGNIDDARILLSAIISAESTVLGLVFSVVLLVLSMAATQFGPRLLRRFIITQNGEITIGLFSATFLFSLFTLMAVHSENGHEFVPQITIVSSVVLMILSFATLISYSEKVRRGIQAGNLIASVNEDLRDSMQEFIEVRKKYSFTWVPRTKFPSFVNK